MKKLIFLCLLVVPQLSVTSGALAAKATEPFAPCTTDSKDPYENPVRMSVRSNFNQFVCLDTSRSRAPQVFVMPSDANQHLATISNVQTAGKFYIAYVPTDEASIESMTLLVLREKKVGFYAGHAQLKIKFKRPVTLLSQTDLKTTVQLSELLFSSQAVYGKDGSFNPLLGLVDNFPVIDRLVSVDQRASEDPETYAAYPLILQPGEKGDLMEIMVQRFDQLAAQYFYNTSTMNCVGEILNLTDALPRFQGQFAKYHTRISMDPILGPGVKAFAERGLIAQPATTKK